MIVAHVSSRFSWWLLWKATRWKKRLQIHVNIYSFICLAASRCTQTQCQNGATCYEHSPGASIFAYCLCPPGFTGRFCETGHSERSIAADVILVVFLSLEYFRCPYAGTFGDAYRCAQGSYFLCDYSSEQHDERRRAHMWRMTISILDRLIPGTCPKGLRFNLNRMSCDQASAVGCPDI